jgi:hypothetical protein
MQPPPQRTSVGLLIGIAFGAGLLGAVCGGFVTYSVMVAERPVPSRPNIVPLSPGFGSPTLVSSSDGWWVYRFSDLDIEVGVPAIVKPSPRPSVPSGNYGIDEVADYMGHGKHTSIDIGAFWTGSPGSNDPVDLANFNSPPGSTGKATATTFSECPASIRSGTYDNSSTSGFKEVYLVRGNGVYYFRCRYWTRNKASAEAEFDRMMRSLTFLGKRPIIR